MSTGSHINSCFFSALSRDTDLCIITLSTYTVLVCCTLASASGLHTTGKSFFFFFFLSRKEMRRAARHFLTGAIWISVGAAATEQSLCLRKQHMITHISCFTGAGLRETLEAFTIIMAIKTFFFLFDFWEHSVDFWQRVAAGTSALTP